MFIALRSIPLDELAEETGVSQKTARRWVHCFSAIMQVEVRRGVVTVPSAYAAIKLYSQANRYPKTLLVIKSVNDIPAKARSVNFLGVNWSMSAPRN